MTLLALLVWLPLTTQGTFQPLSPRAHLSYGEGLLEERDGLRILRLKGAPYERGYQHGVLLAHEIRTGLREHIYRRLILEQGASHFLLLRHAQHVDSYLSSEYREEMKGLADGAGIAYSDVLLLHCFHDLTSQAPHTQGIRDILLTLHPRFNPPLAPGIALVSPRLQPESSSTGHVLSLPLEAAFAAFGSATEDGKLLQGVDFAFPQPFLEQLLLIVYEPQEGNRFVTVAWPGAVGGTIGLNEEKISVAGSSSPSLDASLDGVPLAFLLREVLQYAGDIPTASRLVASAERTMGHNVVIGDGKPADAQALEFSAHLYAACEAEEGLVIRTNHYLEPSLSETQHISSEDEYLSSQARLEATHDRLETDHGQIDLARTVNLVSEDRGESREEQEIVLGVVVASSDLEVWVVSVLYPEERVLLRSLRLDEEA